MRMMSIASGSSGNCIYIGSDNTHILIDDGISRKRIVEALNTIGIDISDISAILITHEHSDHIDGLGVMLRKNNIPVYASSGTINGIRKYSKLGKLDEAQFHKAEGDKEFSVNDLIIHPVNISHDASEPLAYTVSCGSRRCGVITDLGVYDDYIIKNFQKMDSLLIEANHDIRMLEVGTYPYALKRRILGDKGHLSNEASGRLLGKLLNDDMKGVLLGHLSHENNYPELAYETVRFEVDNCDNGYRFNDFNIKVAGRSNPSDVIEF